MIQRDPLLSTSRRLVSRDGWVPARARSPQGPGRRWPSPRRGRRWRSQPIRRRSAIRWSGPRSGGWRRQEAAHRHPRLLRPISAPRAEDGNQSMIASWSRGRLPPRPSPTTNMTSGDLQGRADGRPPRPGVRRKQQQAEGHDQADPEAVGGGSRHQPTAPRSGEGRGGEQPDFRLGEGPGSGGTREPAEPVPCWRALPHLGNQASMRITIGSGGGLTGSLCMLLRWNGFYRQSCPRESGREGREQAAVPGRHDSQGGGESRRLGQPDPARRATRAASSRGRPAQGRTRTIPVTMPTCRARSPALEWSEPERGVKKETRARRGQEERKVTSGLSPTIRPKGTLSRRTR